MTTLERVKGIYEVIAKRYGAEFAKSMMCNIVTDAADYDDLGYEDRVKLYDAVTAIED